MNNKNTYHKPQPHTLRVFFDSSYIDTDAYPSKAAAVRNIPALRERYPLRRIEVIKVAE